MTQILNNEQGSNLLSSSYESSLPPHFSEPFRRHSHRAPNRTQPTPSRNPGETTVPDPTRNPNETRFAQRSESPRASDFSHKIMHPEDPFAPNPRPHPPHVPLSGLHCFARFPVPCCALSSGRRGLFPPVLLSDSGPFCFGIQHHDQSLFDE